MSINYVDLLVIAVIGISVFLGYKKGFLKTLAGLLSIVISLILAMSLQPAVSDALKNTVVYDTAYQSAASVIETPFGAAERISDYGTSGLNLPHKITDSLEENIDAASETAEKEIAETVANSAMKIIALLLIFIAARILIFVIMTLINFLTKLPLIGWSDGLMGALFGVFRGMLIIYIIFALIALFASFSPDNFWAVAINHSKFAKLMYNDNVLLDFIFKG